MNATFTDHSPPHRWRSVLLPVLWLTLATLLGTDLTTPTDITLHPLHVIPAFVAAAFVPPCHASALPAGGLACWIAAGLYFGFRATPACMLRLLAVAAIGAPSVVIAAARNQERARDRHEEKSRAEIVARTDAAMDEAKQCGHSQVMTVEENAAA